MCCELSIKCECQLQSYSTEAEGTNHCHDSYPLITLAFYTLFFLYVKEKMDTGRLYCRRELARGVRVHKSSCVSGRRLFVLLIHIFQAPSGKI